MIFMRKFKLVVSDFHIGDGPFDEKGAINIAEEFRDDRKFEEFLTHYCGKEFDSSEIELIIDGDFFNMLEVKVDGKLHDVITESLSRVKMEKIIAGHPILFNGLQHFAHFPHRTITFITGNHDQPLLFKGVQNLLARRIQAPMVFHSLSYYFKGVYIEHGHQYSPSNAFETQRLFLTHKLKEPVLNLPWGSLFVVKVVGDLKQERPFIDKVKPFRWYLFWGLRHDFVFSVKALAKVLAFFFKTRLVRSRWRRSRFRDTLGMLLEGFYQPKVERFAKQILESGECHTVVLGHTHHYAFRRYGEGKEYFNTGTWNDVISLHVANLGRQNRCTYVLLEEIEGRWRGKLREWRGHPSVDEDVLY